MSIRFGRWHGSPATELGAAPGALYLHAAAYVPTLHAILVAGGRDLPNDITSRIFVFDLATHTWRFLPTCTSGFTAAIGLDGSGSLTAESVEHVALMKTAAGGRQEGFYSSVMLFDARTDRYAILCQR